MARKLFRFNIKNLKYTENKTYKYLKGVDGIATFFNEETLFENLNIYVGGKLVVERGNVVDEFSGDWSFETTTAQDDYLKLSDIVEGAYFIIDGDYKVDVADFDVVFEYFEIHDLAYANNITLESDIDEALLFGDGEVLETSISNNGLSGSLGVINLEDHYEIFGGRLMEIVDQNDEEALAEVEMTNSIPHDIYFETQAIEDGVEKTFKHWLLNCRTGRPSETYEQSTDNKNVSNFEYSLTVLGVPLRADYGLVYRDEKGNEVKVVRITKEPNSYGYETFGEIAPYPIYSE